jgi:hypothetical protein
MTRRLLDYDPLTGISTWFQYQDSTEEMAITTEQDLSPILDGITARRNDTDYSRDGIKNDWWHYARLPLTVIMEMKSKHGVDLMASKVDWKSALKIINREYPLLKTTEKTHA